MRVLIAAILTFISMPAFSEGITEPGRVNTIHFWRGYADAILIKHENMVNPDDCTKPNTWYAIKKDHPHYTEIYSLILSAHATQKKLKFILSGCYIDFPEIEHVYYTN